MATCVRGARARDESFALAEVARKKRGRRRQAQLVFMRGKSRDVLTVCERGSYREVERRGRSLSTPRLALICGLASSIEVGEALFAPLRRAQYVIMTRVTLRYVTRERRETRVAWVGDGWGRGGGQYILEVLLFIL